LRRKEAQRHVILARSRSSHKEERTKRQEKPKKTGLKVKTPGKKDRQAWNQLECDAAQNATRQAIECAWTEARNSFSSVDDFRTGKENK
jgi:hypothetical protein